MLRCLVVDDESGAIDVLSDYIARTPQLELVGTFRDSIEALNFLMNHEVDLVFLDIDMPNLNGLQMTDLIRSRNTMVIFSTAYSEYAVESYEREAVDYLLKPIGFDRFLKAVAKALKKREGFVKKGDGSKGVVLKIFIKSGSKIHRLDIDDLLYMKKDGHYIVFNTTKDQLLSRMNFHELLSSLPEDNFVRIHKSFVIAIDKIDTIEKHFVVIKDAEIPIGDKYREDFFHRIRYSGN